MSPNKGPQGHSTYGGKSFMPEAQERFEANGEHSDVKEGNFTDDPFTLKAHEEDHTPNHTKAPKGAKIGWSFQHGRGNGGVGV